MPTVKEVLTQELAKLPDDVSYEQALEELYTKLLLTQCIERADAKDCKTYTTDEVREQLKSWLQK